MATWHSRSLILGFRKTPHPPIPSFPVFNILTILTQNKTKPSFPGRHQSFNIFRSMFIYLSTQSWVITDLFCMQPYFFFQILISGQGLNLKLLTLTLLQSCFKTHNWYLYSLFLFCLFPILGLFSCSILPLLGTSCDSWNKFWLLSDLTFWSWWQIFQLRVCIWDH